MGDNQVSILIVDDEQTVRELLMKALGPRYMCAAAASADEAIRMVSSASFNLALVDIKMPGASGIELCQVFGKVCPDTVVVMVSGMTDIQYAIESMRQGAFDYVTKPFELAMLTLAVERAIRYQGLVAAKRNYTQSLEQTVAARTEEFRQVNRDLNEIIETLYTNYRATLHALAQALEARDVETRGHSDRVVAYSIRLGKELGLKDRQLIAVEQGALLHDIGKIGVPDAILRNPGALTETEWTEMRKHVGYGLGIIEGIDFLSGARPIVGQHHEKYDGTGYPAGLRGEMIHLNARIFAVADALDAITSERPYRAARSYSEARTEIVRGSGGHFDPAVVEAFLRVPESDWAAMAEQPCPYPHEAIDKREIRSFILSVKHQRGATGPLTPNPSWAQNTNEVRG